MDMRIARNIKNHISAEKLSLSDFAKKVHIPASTLHGWLNGATPKNIQDIKKVADYFGISVDELCFGEKMKDVKRTNIKVLIEDQEFELILKRS